MQILHKRASFFLSDSKSILGRHSIYAALDIKERVSRGQSRFDCTTRAIRKRGADELTLEQDASSVARPTVQIRRLLHPNKTRKE